MGDSREKQERNKRDMKRLLTAITITPKKLMSTQYCGLIMRHKNTEPKNLMELNLFLHYLFSYCLLLNRFFLFLVVYLYLALNSVVKIYILIHTNTSNLRLINAVCQKRRSSSIKHQLVFKQLQNLSFATVGGFYSS